MAEAEITIEICPPDPTIGSPLTVTVPLGTTLEAALRVALPGCDLSQFRLGIYGKLKSGDTLLRQHDRIEVYRPLLADPKDSRRRRAGLRK